MTTSSLQEQVKLLEHSLPTLQQLRTSTPFANDVYEAAVYWRDLGQGVLKGDDQIDYPTRAREEKALLETLTNLLDSRSSEERERYVGVFEIAKTILAHVEATPANRNGHLRTVAIIKTEFAFLQTDYGFKIDDEHPMGVRYSSDSIYVDLRYSKKPSLSCSFGLESKKDAVFWIDDLLFLCGDSKYRSLPQSLNLDTEDEVEKWFRFVADVFKRCGREVLSNQPGIFDRLAHAQSKRDAEFVAAMNEKYGN
jgi:hypothetical protein